MPDDAREGDFASLHHNGPVVAHSGRAPHTRPSCQPKASLKIGRLANGLNLAGHRERLENQFARLFLCAVRSGCHLPYATGVRQFGEHKDAPYTGRTPASWARVSQIEKEATKGKGKFDLPPD